MILVKKGAKRLPGVDGLVLPIAPGWKASFHDHSRWRIIDEEEEDIIGTEGEVCAGITDALAVSLEQQHSSVTKRE